ncbi:hypothetical protein H0H81_002691 [Sphagnurus paluster]|uniref:Uncharacterized protein n=1 Tax=Sphagnurus paluster TaxID=117069 RepID=A0A9P7K1G6_9AGAR|nr:hypothetical protein H0H81_002691 [Sphagnurus paluster]
MTPRQGNNREPAVLAHDQAGHEDQIPAPANTTTNPYSADLSSTSHVNLDTSEYTIIDLYEVRDKSKNEIMPFFSQLRIHGPQGEIMRVWGHFDDGAMVNAMSSEMYQKVQHRLAPLRLSNRKLRMANGSIVTLQGQWEGHIELGGIQVEASFEVFDSGGGWDFLFRKRLMTLFNVIHNYANDTVQIHKGEHQATLQNQFKIANSSNGPIGPPIPECAFIKEVGDSHDESPIREVLSKVIPDQIPADSTLAPGKILEEKVIAPVCIVTDTPDSEEQSIEHETGEEQAPAMTQNQMNQSGGYARTFHRSIKSRKLHPCPKGTSEQNNNGSAVIDGYLHSILLQDSTPSRWQMNPDHIQHSTWKAEDTSGTSACLSGSPVHPRRSAT